MIVVYYKTGNGSCRQAKQWFTNHGITPVEKKIEYISREDLIYVLTLTENGLSDILRRPNKSDSKLKYMLNSIHAMNFNECINFILEHSNLLRTPLIFGKDKLIVGYNSEELRLFLSRKYRTIQLQQ